MNLETSSPKQKYRHLCHLVRLARRYTRIARSVGEALDKHQALDEFTTYHSEIWQLADDIQAEANILYRKMLRKGSHPLDVMFGLDAFVGLRNSGDEYVGTRWAIRQYCELNWDDSTDAKRLEMAWRKDAIHFHFLHRRLLAQDKIDARRLYPNGEIPF